MAVSIPVAIGTGALFADGDECTLTTTEEVPVNGTAFVTVAFIGPTAGTVTIPGWTLDHLHEGTLWSSSGYRPHVARFRRVGALADGSEIVATTGVTVHSIHMWAEYVTSDLELQLDDTGGFQTGSAAWQVDIDISEQGLLLCSVLMPAGGPGANTPVADYADVHDYDSGGYRAVTSYRIVDSGGLYTMAGNTASGLENAVCAVSYVEDFSAPPIVVTVEMSGGVDNTVAAVSLGGAPSGHDVPALLFFDNVLRAEADVGSVKYRCLYFRNLDLTPIDVIAWIHTQAGNAVLAIGVAPEPAAEDADVELIDDELSAPAGVSFVETVSSLSPVELGELGPGESRALWIQRTVPVGVAGRFVNEWEIYFGVTAL